MTRLSLYNVSGWTVTIEKYRGSVSEVFRKMTFVPQLNDRKGIRIFGFSEATPIYSRFM